MKKLFSFGILLAISMGVFSQNSKNIPISIGYLGNLGYHPGLKVGTQFDLKNWETEAEKFTKLQSFYVSPQVGFYVYPNVHTGYIVNADFGYKRIKNHKNKYSAFSIGLGFLNQSQIIERRVKLSDGSQEKIRENWGWFMPTLNYEFGKAINEKIGWYGKGSYGFKMASSRENAAVLFVELGLTFKMWQISKTCHIKQTKN